MTQQYEARTPIDARHRERILKPQTAPEVMSFNGVPGIGSTDSRIRRPKALRSENDDNTM